MEASEASLGVNMDAILTLDFNVDFGVNACLAKSRYSFIHSSIVIRNLPSMIAMILRDSVSQRDATVM